MKKRTTIEIIAILFVTLFLYTGISKWMDYYVFKEQIALSPLLAPIAQGVAILLPATEIIVSVILFIPRTRQIGLYASFILMILFTGYIIYVLNYNPQLPCTCGGFIQALSWHQHLVLNIVLIILSLRAIILMKKPAPEKIDKVSSTSYN